jgi:hypothetical protein
MKKILIFTVFLLTIFSVATFAQNEPVFKKYDLISGYVEYRISGSGTGKVELFFDEYGSFNMNSGLIVRNTLGKTDECNIVEITTPDSNYIIDIQKATGTKGPADDISRAKEIFKLENGDFEKTKAQLMKDDGYRKVGVEKVLDRVCIVWEKTKDETIFKIWEWKGVELKSSIISSQYELIMEAVKIILEEPIPFTKFEPPSGIVWEEKK